LNWGWLVEAGAMLGFQPADTLALTLPEMLLCMRGWQRANGVDPDKNMSVQPMTRTRLLELIEKELFE